MSVFVVELKASYKVYGAENEFTAVECALKSFQTELTKWEHHKTNKFKSWDIHVLEQKKTENAL